MRSDKFLCHCICHSVCVLNYCKNNQSISLKLDDMIGPTNRKNWLTFDGYRVPDTDFGSLFPSPHHCEIRDFRTFINLDYYIIFSYGYGPIFMTLGEMTDADKIMNLQHFLSDPVHIRIRIRILKKKSGFESRIIFSWGKTPRQRFALFQHSQVRLWGKKNASSKK